MKSTFQSFTELEVWKSSRQLTKEIWLLVKTFPEEEKYRLVDQLIRCSRSIGANIAEGHGRFTFKDDLSFSIRARGSLNELYHHLIDAYDCSYIDYEKLKYFKAQIDKTGKLLNGYIKFLRNQHTNFTN